MTEEEIVGRVRQIEQIAQRLSRRAVVMFSRCGERFGLGIHWFSGGPTLYYEAENAETVLSAAEAKLGERLAVDVWWAREEAAAGQVSDALARAKERIFGETGNA